MSASPKQFNVNWVDRGYEPTQKPNPAYPAGQDMDCSAGALQSCKLALPYPARRCGYHVVVCKLCGTNAIATTAGRPDDPRSLRLACKL